MTLSIAVETPAQMAGIYNGIQGVREPDSLPDRSIRPIEPVVSNEISTYEVYHHPGRPADCYVGKLQNLPPHIQFLATNFVADLYAIHGGFFNQELNDQRVRNIASRGNETLDIHESEDIHFITVDRNTGKPLAAVKLAAADGAQDDEFEINNLPAGQYFDIDMGNVRDTPGERLVNGQVFELSRLGSINEVRGLYMLTLRSCLQNGTPMTAAQYNFYRMYLPDDEVPDENTVEAFQSFKKPDDNRTRAEKKTDQKVPGVLMISCVEEYVAGLKKKYRWNEVALFGTMVRSVAGAYLTQHNLEFREIKKGRLRNTRAVKQISAFFADINEIVVFRMNSDAILNSPGFRGLRDECEVPQRLRFECELSDMQIQEP